MVTVVVFIDRTGIIGEQLRDADLIGYEEALFFEVAFEDLVDFVEGDMPGIQKDNRTPLLIV